MKIALIGDGVMGNLIESLAVTKGHEIAVAIGKEESRDSVTDLVTKVSGADVAIDFSIGEAVKKNTEICSLAGIPLIEGTTGWMREMAIVRQIIQSRNGTFVYGANFSLGVNLFYRIVSYSAELFSRFHEYEPFIEEQHHSRKVDSPSGTALKLQSLAMEHISEDIPVAATRAGNIPGTHRVGFDGIADQILLEHTARNREGFAAGAILAAEWSIGKSGFWEFSEIIDQILNPDENDKGSD